MEKVPCLRNPLEDIPQSLLSQMKLPEKYRQRLSSQQELALDKFRHEQHRIRMKAQKDCPAPTSGYKKPFTMIILILQRCCCLFRLRLWNYENHKFSAHHKPFISLEPKINLCSRWIISPGGIFLFSSSASTWTSAFPCTGYNKRPFDMFSGPHDGLTIKVFKFTKCCGNFVPRGCEPSQRSSEVEQHFFANCC